MIAGLAPIAIAAVGAAYAGLVIRAAPTRRDNLMFGAVALTDAAMTAWRGINVLAGDAIVASAVTVPCALMTIALAVLSIDLIASFPRRPGMAWKWRTLLIAWAATAAYLVCCIDRDPSWRYSAAEFFFFLPANLLLFGLAAVGWRRTRDRAARTVIAMIAFRWGFGFVAYHIAPRYDAFEQTVWVETTVVTLLSFVVIGTAVLRTELFSLRSTAAEVITVATIAMFVALGGGSAVFATLHWTEPGNLRGALLVGSTFVPLALFAFGRAMYPRLEKNVLAGLDERRARRLGVQGEPLPPEPTAAIAEANRRIAAIGDGSDVTWQTAAQLAPDLAKRLATGEPQRHDTGDACFVVPALGAERTLIGAFSLRGGTIDRDTYVVARDLAARVALAVERAEAVSELEGARQLAALGQFAAAIAHDIRTPLTSISLNVQILRRKLQLPDDDREHLDIALEELARLDRSVAEILDFAKPVKLAPQPIDVGELLEATTRGLSPVLSEKGVALHCESARAIVNGDPQRLRQVIVNLVGNAADASQPGAAVTVRSRAAEGAQVAIEVEDHGRGIDAIDLPRIFEPFFTTRPDGTGLGLAICHKVIRAHGGDIHVRSTPGAGSIFTVLLPEATEAS